MRLALARHDSVLHEVIAMHEGWLFKHTGDGVLAAFASARAAVDAAVAAQRRLDLPVRMGICTGGAEARGDDYFGPTLNRAARIAAAGHGGQVLLAASTAAIIEGFDLDDLGEHRLRDLSQAQRLYQVRAAGLRPTFPPLRSLEVALGNLPAPATSLWGRERDLREIAALLGTARLVTLTGVGGVGKTRLALQVAADNAARFYDGTWLVELAAVVDPAATRHAVAAVLGVSQQSGQTIEQSIAAALGGRRLLLLLDNCEHLIDAAAALARVVLAHCPQVTLLATSRETLMIEGEHVWPVSSLDYRDGVGSPAVRLFAERASAVVPEFALDADAEAVGEICRRLDGIPLAIELAAARTRVMSPAQIRDRLDERFRLLAGQSRRALDRHQTLRNAVQWSFDLLSLAERMVLARSSSFAGGFTLAAAERVCSGGDVAAADLLDHLDSLVRKSLVTVERSADAIRYGLLETIRQFGEEQLMAMGEGDGARRRHAEFFAEDSDRQYRSWLSPAQLSAYTWLDRELDNLRAAFRWAIDARDIDFAARIASNVGDMARFRLRGEAANWAEEIVDAARSNRHRRLAVLLAWAASSAWAFGRLEDARRYGEESIALRDNPHFDQFVWAYADLAIIAMYQGDAGGSIAMIRAGAEHPGDRNDRFCLAMLPHFLALSGRRDEAMAAAADVVSTVERAGVPSSTAVAYFSKGHAFAQTDPATALAAFDRAIAIARRSGNRFWESLAIPEVAAIQARSGDPTNALRSFRQMLDAWRGAPDMMFVSHGLGNLIVLFVRLDLAAPAATLHGTLRRLLRHSDFIQDLPNTVLRIRDALGEAPFAELERQGGEMALHEATAFAQEQISQALAALGA